MTSVSAVNSTSLLILRQSQSTAATPAQKNAGSGDLVAIANGLSGRTGETGQPGQVQSAVPDSMLELTRLKMDLYKRTGQALGVNMDDYASPKEYAAALRQAISDIKVHNPDRWPEIKANIEHELGLDKLGVSLETVIDSIENADGESDKALTKALEKQAGMVGSGNDGTLAAQHSAVQINEIGMYRPAKV